VAAPTGQLKASRYFLALVGTLIVLYALVFFTGDKLARPKLGLDVKGGTSMTLSASLPGGKDPDSGKLGQARQIIADRVDASGVSEPEVVTEGNKNIVVNVAGATDPEELRKLVAPAELRFRKVLDQVEDSSAAQAEPSESPSESPSASPSAAPSASATPSATPSGKPSATPSASGSAAPSASASASAAPVDTTTEQKRKAVIDKLGEIYQFAEQGIQDAKQVDPQLVPLLQPFSKLTPEEVAVLPTDIQFKVPTISCKQLDARPAGVLHDQNQQVVACGKGGSGGHAKYKLDKSTVLGEDVAGASFDNNVQEGGWFVSLSFKGGGQDRWTKLTQEAFNNNKQQVAIVLDNTVVSAPSIEGVITGDAVIKGSFTKDEVQTLSRQLKYGSLPLSFKIESVDNVPPTLGVQQMKYGLLAGAIGLVLVIVYAFFYYRALGLVVVTSLVASGALVYGSLVLLGRYNGFTLTLSGIAGFIVAIGITADSFVVFFERLKDEVKDGRTVRSAVPRAWVRARRTILSADTVSFLAAAVLYILAIGPVKGFAFTLGMSTIIDLVVVFLFTHPLVAALSRSSAFTSPRISGLGNLRSDKAITAATATPRFGAVRTKES
jgi:preprotein translocase subunit SecD